MASHRRLAALGKALRAAVLAAPLFGVDAHAQPATVTSVRSLYVLHCAGCHAMDASGHPDQGVPSMRGMLGHFMRLPEGRAFLVQVPGVNNAGLSDEEIATLTNWTVQQFSAQTAPAGWSPYTAAEVALAKRQRPLDVAKARSDLIARLREAGVQMP